jgi:hypothetical protein
MTTSARFKSPSRGELSFACAAERLPRFIEQTAPLIVADGLDTHTRQRREASYRQFSLHQNTLDSVPYYGL